MRDSGFTPFRALCAALALYVAFFAFLSADVTVRVFGARSDFQSTMDAAVLMILELARGTAIVVSLVLALRLARADRRPVARLLTLAVLLLGVWFAKITAFEAFPGHAQEWLADGLLRSGTPPRLLQLIFARPVWSFWLALGAFLRLSVTWPAALQASSIEGSGLADRTGMMRNVALAGVDVGRGFRHLAARLVEERAFRPWIVWPATAVLGLVHAMAGPIGLRVGLDALMAMLLALGITNLRAAHSVAGERARRRVLWVTQSALTAMSAFVLVGLLSLQHDAGTVATSLGISIIAPFAVLMGFGSAVLGRAVTDPRPALRRTTGTSMAAVLGVVSYLLIQLALKPVARDGIPIVEVAGVLASAVLIAVTRSRWRGLADQFVGGVDAAGNGRRTSGPARSEADRAA
jgi:hypothetical protein